MRTYKMYNRRFNDFSQVDSLQQNLTLTLTQCQRLCCTNYTGPVPTYVFEEKRDMSEKQPSVLSKDDTAGQIRQNAILIQLNDVTRIWSNYCGSQFIAQFISDSLYIYLAREAVIAIFHRVHCDGVINIKRNMPSSQ